MTNRTDPYGRGDQPEEPKPAIRPLRPLRVLFWWMFLCDLAEGKHESWEPHHERCLEGVGKRMLAAAAIVSPWLLGGLLGGRVPVVIGGALFVLFWPTRVWIRMALGLRSSAAADGPNEDRVWRDDPVYEAWKDRFCR